MEKTPQKLSPQFAKISFYVAAHADDWQLFMHPNVYLDLVQPDCKVVFVITTAGDAGMPENYWAAREEGLKSSVRFCIAPRSILSEVTGETEFNSRTAQYWRVNNTTSYFLRLPDGNINGSGFAAYNFQSLARLKSGDIHSVTSLDNAATYHGWQEFVTTIESIITFESQGIPNMWIHYLNPDTVKNPDDHADHIMTGQAIQDLTVLKTLHQLLFVGYSVSRIQENLTLTDLFWKAGMMAAYEKAVYDISGYSTLRENADLYVSWCCSRAKFVTISPASLTQ